MVKLSESKGSSSIGRFEDNLRLDSAKLFIVPFQQSDKMDWFKIDSNPLVRKFLPGKLPTRQQAYDYIDESITSYSRNGFGRYAVRLRETGELVGMCGFLLEDYGVDFGYRYSPSFWGMGIGYEAARSVLDFGLDSIQAEKIVALVLEGNTASVRIINKLKFSFEGKISFENYDNVLKYSMTLP